MYDTKLDFGKVELENIGKKRETQKASYK